MIEDAVQIAAECIKHPNRRAIWSDELGMYICPESTKRELAQLKARSLQKRRKTLKHHPPLGREFKIVFVTAVSGTLLFTLLCTVLTLAAGKEQPELLERIAIGFFDIAKTGFGAVVGLLGAKLLQQEEKQ